MWQGRALRDAAAAAAAATVAVAVAVAVVVVASGGDVVVHVAVVGETLNGCSNCSRCSPESKNSALSTGEGSHLIKYRRSCFEAA